MSYLFNHDENGTYQICDDSGQVLFSGILSSSQTGGFKRKLELPPPDVIGKVYNLVMIGKALCRFSEKSGLFKRSGKWENHYVVLCLASGLLLAYDADEKTGYALKLPNVKKFKSQGTGTSDRIFTKTRESHYFKFNWDFGNLEVYLSKDMVNWSEPLEQLAKNNLPVIVDPAAYLVERPENLNESVIKKPDVAHSCGSSDPEAPCPMPFEVPELTLELVCPVEIEPNHLEVEVERPTILRNFKRVQNPRSKKVHFIESPVQKLRAKYLTEKSACAETELATSDNEVVSNSDLANTNKSLDQMNAMADESIPIGDNFENEVTATCTVDTGIRSSGEVEQTTIYETATVDETREVDIFEVENEVAAEDHDCIESQDRKKAALLTMTVDTQIMAGINTEAKSTNTTACPHKHYDETVLAAFVKKHDELISRIEDVIAQLEAAQPLREKSLTDMAHLRSCETLALCHHDSDSIYSSFSTAKSNSAIFDNHDADICPIHSRRMDFNVTLESTDGDGSVESEPSNVSIISTQSSVAEMVRYFEEKIELDIHEIKEKPGIDIIYSDPKEVEAIQAKLIQVRSLGCSAFALLFDDIETTMNDRDRKQFPSFVMAQLTVSNEVYEHMERPLFFFCPTEYCESRAVPNLDESSYLNTLGDLLHPDIHILWTGPRVVSRLLTVDHIRQVAKVIKRKPLIWDNLHANDYDPKRVFLGPFSGRPVELKRETSGVLLNPNCKYEANFIPFCTLADWNLSQMENFDDEIASPRCDNYRPELALQKALRKWLPHFNHGPGPAIPPISQMETQITTPIIDPNAVSITVPPPSIRTCEGNELLPTTEIPLPLYTSPIGSATTITVQTFPLSEAIIGVAAAHDHSIPLTVNSLTSEYSEPMDSCSIKEDSNANNSPMELSGPENSDITMDEAEEPALTKSDLRRVASIGRRNIRIELDQLALFVDMFYLPFEHGKRGMELLENLQWLLENAHSVQNCSSDDDISQESPRVEWMKRHDAIQSLVDMLTRFYCLVIDSPNKSLVQEIFPYIWECQGVLAVISCVIDWMRRGCLPSTRSDSIKWWENGEFDFEPWTLAGGLLTDLQKMIVMSQNVADVFFAKCAIPLTLTCYSFRVWHEASPDLASFLYENFASKEDKILCHSLFSKDPSQFFFDKYFAVFLDYGRSPCHHLVCEEIGDDGSRKVFAVAVVIEDIRQFVVSFKEAYLPNLIEKYKTLVMDDESESSEEKVQLIIDEIEKWPLNNLSNELFKKCPTFVGTYWKNVPLDVASLPVRRLLQCAVATFGLRGSVGFMSAVPFDRAPLLMKLGLEVFNEHEINGYSVMGHVL